MNTRDLSKFGYREYGLAGELLTLISNGPDSFQNQGDFCNFHTGQQLQLEMNDSSGNVFLVDSNSTVWMVNDRGKVERFISCPNCGNEGFETDSTCFKTRVNDGIKCLSCKESF